MGEVFIEGEDAVELLQKLVPQNVYELSDKQIRYYFKVVTGTEVCYFDKSGAIDPINRSDSFLFNFLFISSPFLLLVLSE